MEYRNPLPSSKDTISSNSANEEGSHVLSLHRRIYTLQIILTNYCNLHCKYCYVRKTNARSISIDTAKKSIIEMIENYPPNDWSYDICFMGGEPLAEFEKIKIICEWTWSSFPDINVHISSPTNGTLLNEYMRSWFKKNRLRFSLGLSYDGDSFQNYNRSDSILMVDTSFFKELWPDQPFKMTVSEHNVQELSYNIIALQERGYRVGANAACGEPVWSFENVREFGRQMLILAQYYVDHPYMELIDLIDVELTKVFNFEQPMIRRCGIGFNYHTIDIDGKKYPCHLFSSLALTEEEINKSKKYLMDKRNDFTVSSCQKCILNPICPRCYGMSYLRTGNPFTIDMNICRLFKQQVRGACSYHLKRIARLDSISKKDHLVICAIKLILRNFHFE